MSTAKTKRPKKPRLAPSVTPWEALILAVDPGERSGWSLWYRGVPLMWGECGAFDGSPVEVVRMAKFRCSLEESTPPLVVVVERPFRTRFGTQVAVGAGDLIWRRAAEAAGLKARIVRVYPATWRARVMAKGSHSAKREVVKERELRQAQMLVERHKHAAEQPAIGVESAPAVLIGQWATYAGEVGARLPKQRKKRAA